MNSQTKRKTQKMMLQPINQIFHLFTSKQRVQIWLYDHKNLVLEGVIQGFDEYMNIVLDQASEVYTKKEVRRETSVGQLLLRGENISLIFVQINFIFIDVYLCYSYSNYNDPILTSTFSTHLYPILSEAVPNPKSS
ncbi:LSM domain protein [Cryptosporidium meleagridis]|uniref:Small nuclear ribonucleoprotein E n=1 Tax=Cryptosporidium meleagridis TaxID=93969 RepID=A0A2P4YX07_9CRYT|nr:LSM domain protein [Cryptosporidium meleagridis]